MNFQKHCAILDIKFIWSMSRFYHHIPSKNTQALLTSKLQGKTSLNCQRDRYQTSPIRQIEVARPYSPTPNSQNPPVKNCPKCCLPHTDYSPKGWDSRDVETSKHSRQHFGTLSLPDEPSWAHIKQTHARLGRNTFPSTTSGCGDTPSLRLFLGMIVIMYDI